MAVLSIQGANSVGHIPANPQVVSSIQGGKSAEALNLVNHHTAHELIEISDRCGFAPLYLSLKKDQMDVYAAIKNKLGLAAYDHLGQFTNPAGLVALACKLKKDAIALEIIEECTEEQLIRGFEDEIPPIFNSILAGISKISVALVEKLSAETLMNYRDIYNRSLVQIVIESDEPKQELFAALLKKLGKVGILGDNTEFVEKKANLILSVIDVLDCSTLLHLKEYVPGSEFAEEVRSAILQRVEDRLRTIQSEAFLLGFLLP
ncbi:MAG: hypothetical protein K1X28_01850 [Parachlamydiales bacterium]|nr:hypothetical protein [Parachlamydiales bacterium]